MATKLEIAQDKCFEIMMKWEGLSMTGLIGDFDGALWTYSVGFTLKYGDLQQLIRELHKEDPKLFTKCVTVYVEAYNKQTDLTQSLLNMTKLNTKEVTKWALDRQNEAHKVDKHWVEAFKNLGNQPKFQAVQKRLYYKKFKRAISYCYKYNLLSERALMLFFDCIVQQGSMKSATQARIDKRVKAIKSTGLVRDKRVMKICAEEMANQALDRWAEDVFSRRICIVNGKGVVHGRVYDLNKEYGLTDEKVLNLPLKSKISNVLRGFVR